MYGPSAVRYVMHQRVHQEQDYGMGTQTQDLGYRVFVSATIILMLGLGKRAAKPDSHADPLAEALAEPV